MTGEGITVELANGSRLVIAPGASATRHEIWQLADGDLAPAELAVETHQPPSDLPDPAPGVTLVVPPAIVEANPHRPDLIPSEFGTVSDHLGVEFPPSQVERNGTNRSISHATGTPPTRALSDPPPKHLVVLSGGDPLVNLQAIATFQPERVTILGFKNDPGAATSLSNSIAKLKSPPDVNQVTAKDARNARAINSAVGNIEHGWALCYSGGTRIAASASRICYQKWGDTRPRYSFAVDGGLLHDDCHVTPLATAPKMAALVQARGNILEKGEPPKVSAAQIGLAKKQIRSRINAAKPAEPLNIPLPKKAQESSPKLAELITEAGGWWFEQLVGAFAKEVADEVRVNPKLCVNGSAPDNFELDVLIRKGWDLALISSTLSTTRPTLKNKFFEAQHRLRQLTGGHVAAARYALVCLAPDDQVASLAGNIGDTGEGLPMTRIFGKSDVLAWLDGDRSSLEEFISASH